MIPPVWKAHWKHTLRQGGLWVRVIHRFLTGNGLLVSPLRHLQCSFCTAASSWVPRVYGGSHGRVVAEGPGTTQRNLAGARARPRPQAARSALRGPRLQSPWPPAPCVFASVARNSGQGWEYLEGVALGPCLFLSLAAKEAGNEISGVQRGDPLPKHRKEFRCWAARMNVKLNYAVS